MNQSSITNDVHDFVTSHIIKQLSDGIVPWKIIWIGNGQPQNMLSGKKYRGINTWLLLGHGFSQNFFMSEEQIKQLGGSIRPSEVGYPVIYWTTLEGQEILSIQSILVYNIDQCKNIPENKIPSLATEDSTPVKKCRELIAQMPNPPTIVHEEEDTLYYDPEKDYIQIPPMAKFESIELYYKTLFSELVRSAFHPSRLVKQEIEIKQLNAELFTLESLVAEMGSTYLASLTGLNCPIIDEQGSFKKAWIETFKEDKFLLVKAGTLAQRAVDYIIGDVVNSEVQQHKQAVLPIEEEKPNSGQRKEPDF